MNSKYAIPIVMLLFLAQVLPLFTYRWVEDESWYSSTAYTLFHEGKIRNGVFPELDIESKADTRPIAMPATLALAFATFGVGPGQARLPELLAMLATIPVVFWLGMLLGSPQAGVLAALLTSVDNMVFPERANGPSRGVCHIFRSSGRPPLRALAATQVGVAGVPVGDRSWHFLQLPPKRSGDRRGAGSSAPRGTQILHLEIQTSLGAGSGRCHYADSVLRVASGRSGENAGVSRAVWTRRGDDLAGHPALRGNPLRRPARLRKSAAELHTLSGSASTPHRTADRNFVTRVHTAVSRGRTTAASSSKRSNSSVVTGRALASPARGHIERRDGREHSHLHRPPQSGFEVAEVAGQRRFLHPFIPYGGDELTHGRGGHLHRPDRGSRCDPPA